jgi:hypothetical protein
VTCPRIESLRDLSLAASASHGDQAIILFQLCAADRMKRFRRGPRNVARPPADGAKREPDDRLALLNLS